MAPELIQILITAAVGVLGYLLRGRAPAPPAPAPGPEPAPSDRPLLDLILRLLRGLTPQQLAQVEALAPVESGGQAVGYRVEITPPSVRVVPDTPK
jgi:hypothetical protein